MAGPLSITASIIAVIQPSTKAAEYTREFADAAGYRDTRLLEMSVTKGILDMLWNVGQGTPDDDGETMANTRMLEEPLNNYSALLMRLEDILAPAKGLKKVGKAFRWPIQKAELSRAVHQEVEALENQHRNEEMREIIRWLSPLNFAAKHLDVFARHQEGTGQWLLNDDRFVEWERGSSQIMWCPGVSGAGNTYFASIALDCLRVSSKDDDDMAVVGIYCDYEEFSQQSTAKYIASLLQQLIIQCPSIPDPTKRTYNERSIARRGHLRAFQDIWICWWDGSDVNAHTG
ncbi:hypothetical protein FE257_005614 [Aspergillus nanangensis]|uniref:Nephrocystin 3-like N-terminal domain-containing protein n=1 Tax=Aspergillus nanangensis TaxID=2582783 RepID=A0AAD4CQC9_ASPNN|nr:hypothetical protein FE257_005614 [Aspergillus nanangensis]